jgi:Fe2+ or Zn2+ uptake regulation protein
MSSLSVFAKLMETTKQLEDELGLDDLTTNEQRVYASILLLSNDSKGVSVTIHQLFEHKLAEDIPIPTLYRALKTLIASGKIKHCGTERSGIYALV